ncbi:hypothetical protein MTO96_013613 [Rhipicephalus appendiculatus]
MSPVIRNCADRANQLDWEARTEKQNRARKQVAPRDPFCVHLFTQPEPYAQIPSKHTGQEAGSAYSGRSSAQQGDESCSPAAKLATTHTISQCAHKCVQASAKNWAVCFGCRYCL